ncbi:hypothetical protein D8Y22_07155 [Salinadaptatus halalkaliphilus]|uniref:SipW-cognate class signal peptide n=1 Tax=Salinadaptatus halalkaliphilus TaxID=2419781 RepID=A0A4S3TMT0_9EURY|nr:SipW-dependent-type signal peptide-containing protein [Salinadaptatus halalkaliphilus]THE65584.1 hypothetical protein D8Y22_07155 [Salinadaptatus halalkaliphilus]
MSDESKLRLTRRRALGGLAGIGIASAGAGIGTSAYFSDQESFENNSITAGEFGLTVVPKVEDIDQDGIGPDEDLELTQTEGEGEGDHEAIVAINPIEITDAKPGDSYEFCWEITVDENPGYVALAADSEDKDGYEEGNIDVEDLWDVDNAEELTTIADATEVDDVTLEGETIASYESLADLLEDLEDGELLVDGDGNAAEFEIEIPQELCIELSIPTDVGNELQGAVLEWDLAFYAEQQRHNDDLDEFVDRAAASLGGD